MKTVVIIGADFSPSSLPPATRIRFFAKHLPEFGWEPVVLTTIPEYYEAPVDAENEQLLPRSLEVIRTRAIPASLTRRIRIGDLGMRSIAHHWRALSRLHKERKIDLIFIPVPPYIPMVLGRLMHLRFGTPYVFDYIDPWVTEYYWQLPNNQRPRMWPLAYALSRTLEPWSIRRASQITGVSKGVTDSVVERYPRLRSEDGTAIPYGGEASDFQYAKSHPRTNVIFDRSDGLLHVSYVGACTVGMLQTIRAFFQAVKVGREKRPLLFSKLRLHFVGSNYGPKKGHSSEIMCLAEEVGITEIIDEHPTRVSYLDSLQIMLDSHALAIFGYEEPHYAASKIYPCVLARKPLLAILHEDSSPVSILEELQASETVTFGPGNAVSKKITEIEAKLGKILAFPRDYEPQTNWKAFEPHTTRAMTRRLVNVFEAVLAARSAGSSPSLNLSLSQSERD